MVNADATQMIRFILFVDRQSDGTLPTVGEVLESSTFKSFKNWGNNKRFKFLIDKFVHLNNTDKISTSFRGFKKIPKSCQIVRYDGNAGTVADLRENGLHCLIIRQ